MFLAKQISLGIKYSIHLSIVGYDLRYSSAMLSKQNISDDMFSSYVSQYIFVPHVNENANISIRILTFFFLIFVLMTKILV